MCLALVDLIFNSVKNKVQEIHHPQIHWLTAGRERLILVLGKANAQMLILCNNMQNNLAAGSWGEKPPRPLTSSLWLLHVSRDSAFAFLSAWSGFDYSRMPVQRGSWRMRCCRLLLGGCWRMRGGCRGRALRSSFPPTSAHASALGTAQVALQDTF